MSSSVIPNTPPAPHPTLAPDASVRLRNRSRTTGALVMGVFGTLWAAAGVGLSSAPAWAWFVLGCIVLAFGVRTVRLLRANPTVAEPLPAELAERRRRGGRIFAWTSAGEGLGIFLAINVVVNLGHPQWQAAAAMAVIGLHFLPLAVAFGYRPHLVTGVAMTAWALVYPWWCVAGAMAPAGMLGAGVILFASAGWALHSAR